MRVYRFQNIELTQKVNTPAIDLETYSREVGRDANVFSFELEASSGVVVDSGVVFTFQVSNDQIVWRTITGSTTTHTGAGITQRVQLPPVKYLRAAITTVGTTANQLGDVTIALATHPYTPA